MKKCGTCKLDKPESEFGRDKSRKDGLRHRCRQCVAAYDARPENQAYHKAYNATPQRRAYSKAYDVERRSRPEAKACRKERYIERRNTVDGRLAKHRSEAKRRNLEDTLTNAQLKVLFLSDCFYCDEPPLNGIDRVDSSLGYVEGNCVSACMQCNYAKLDYTREEHIAKCREVAKKHPLLPVIKPRIINTRRLA